MNNNSPLIDLDEALRSEVPVDKHRNKVCVTEAFDVIEKHINRKVPLATVLLAFNVKYGLDVTSVRFRQLLNAERERRAKASTATPTKLAGV